MVSDHGVDRSLQPYVAAPDRVPHPLVPPRRPQPLELTVQVEHEHGSRRATRDPRRAGMHANDEEADPGDAEPEVRVPRIRRDARAPVMLSVDIQRVEDPQLLPQKSLEFGLRRGNVRATENAATNDTNVVSSASSAVVAE